MADKDLTVHLKADDDISKAAKSAKSELDRIPDRVETTLDVDSSGLDDLSGKLGDLPGLLGDVGGMLSGGGGIAAGAGLAAAAANDLAQGFADAAIEARVTADLTGATIEDASRLQAVWKQSGADINDLNDVLLQMNGVLQTSPEKAKQIGVNLKDGADIGSRFVEVIGKIQNSTLGAADKAQLMSQMFGEEGVRQVAKLTASIDGPLSKAIADVSDAQVIDEKEEARAKKLTAASKDLRRAWEDFKMTAGSILLEPVANSMTKTTAAAEGLKTVVSGGDMWDNSGMDAYRESLGELGAHLDTTVDNYANYQAQVAAADETTGEQVDSVKVVVDGFAALSDALKESAANERELAAATLEGVDAATAYAATIEAMSDARRAAADTTFAVRDAQRDYNESLTEYAEAAADVELSAADLEAVQDSSTETAIRLADSQARLASETAAAAGQTFDAADSQDVFNQSMIDSARQAGGPLKDAIIRYIATVNDIPPEKVSEIVAITNYASLSSASAALNQTAADRDSKIRAEAVNIPPTEAGLNYLARPRTVTITPQVQAARNLAVPPGATGFAAPMTATATATGPATYTTPVAAAAPLRLTVPTPTVVFNFNGPSLGNRFDTQRAVTKALRAHQRLNGVRA